MAISKWTDPFFAKLQTLLGERSPKSESAVRWKDITDVYDEAAGRALVISTKTVTDALDGVVPGLATSAELAAVIADLEENVSATDAAQAQLTLLTNGVVTSLDGLLANLQTELSATTSLAATTSSNLGIYYYTQAQTDTAIAATKTVLDASIQSVTESVQGFQKILDAPADVAIGSAVAVAVAGAALGQADTLTVTEGATARVTSGATNGASVQIPVERALLFAGQRIKIGVLAKQPAAGHATKFGVAYACSDGNSGYMAAASDLTVNWQWFTFYYDVPAAAVGGPAHLGIFGDDAKSGLATRVARVYIEIAAIAGELPEINNLSGRITSIEAVDISALTGTALAVLLTQMDVDAGGNSAFVTSQTAAMATLEGNAAASYVLRVGAGGASAGFEVVAADDPVSGSASTIKLSAKHIEIQASSLRISDNANLFPDFDMLDPDFYASSNGAVYSFIGSAQAEMGRQTLSISANVAAKQVETGWFALDPSAEYLVTSFAWLSAAPGSTETVTVQLQEGSVDSAGVVTPGTLSNINAATNATFNAIGSKDQVTVNTGASTRRGRFVFTRSAGGTALAEAGGIAIRKKANSVVIANGSIFGNHLDVASAVITQTAQIADLVVTTAKIDDLAVTTGKIADLSVDTLQIAGHAVTIPVTTYDSYPVYLTSKNAWYDVATVSIDRAGLSTLITFSASIHISSDARLEYEVQRDGTTFYSAQQALDSFFGSGGDMATIVVVDTDTGSGWTTYKVKARNTFNPGGEVSQRTLSAHQFKK